MVTSGFAARIFSSDFATVSATLTSEAPFARKTAKVTPGLPLKREKERGSS
ncbi:hypothetical protein D3C72_2373210 [compost metagenome]